MALADNDRMQYLAAEVLHYHNRFDDASPRFAWLVEHRPESRFVVWANSLTVDGLRLTGQLEVLEQTLDGYLAIPALGPDPATWDERRRGFREMRRNAQFVQAQRLAQEGRNAEGAERFMAFHEAYLGTELGVQDQVNYALMALYNAALLDEQAGETQRAAQRYLTLRQLSSEQPHGDEWARQASEGLYRIDPETYPL